MAVLVSTHVTITNNHPRGASFVVQVVQFDVPVPLKSVAQITVPDASTLMIAPFDRSSLRDIEKAILESDLGINPNNDGERIRLGVPPLTQVRRRRRKGAAGREGATGQAKGLQQGHSAVVAGG